MSSGEALAEWLIENVEWMVLAIGFLAVVLVFVTGARERARSRGASGREAKEP